MKKYILFLLIVLCSGCGIKSNNALYFFEQTTGYEKIAEVDDRTVYSNFDLNYYFYNGDRITISSAFENNYLSLNDLLSNMEVYSNLEDGSIVYKHVKDNNSFANTDFYLALCNNSYNTNIYIGINDDIGDKCSN